MRRLGIILLSMSLFISFNGYSAHHGEAHSHQKAVLVTGSNSGLGLRMTQELSKNGFYVYAGVLHKDEMKKGKTKAFALGGIGGFFIGILLTILVAN